MPHPIRNLKMPAPGPDQDGPRSALRDVETLFIVGLWAVAAACFVALIVIAGSVLCQELFA